MDKMKKIYWWIQQINRIGGTEMVSLDLANSLVDHYDITFISTVKIREDIPYKIDPRIKLISLEIPPRCEQIDYLSKKYLKHFRIFSLLFLLLQIMYHYVIRRGHYRKKVYKLLEKDNATLICSSIDTYLLAPKKGRVFFHYHFDSDSFFNRDGWAVKRSRRPDKFIFLSNATKNEITTKQPDLKDIATYIYNPIRFESVLNTDYFDNTIVFVGRYAEQKNPLLTLAIAKELKERNFKFKLKMFGNGPLLDEVMKYYEDNNLQDVVEINGFSEHVNEEILHSDMLLVTSRYEGFSLVMSEANALSRPWVSSNYGNTLKERLVKDRNGVVVEGENPKDYADAIIELLSDKDKLKKMKEYSYEESKKLSKEVIVPEWIKILG